MNGEISKKLTSPSKLTSPRRGTSVTVMVDPDEANPGTACKSAKVSKGPKSRLPTGVVESSRLENVDPSLSVPESVTFRLTISKALPNSKSSMGTPSIAKSVPNRLTELFPNVRKVLNSPPEMLSSPLLSISVNAPPVTVAVASSSVPKLSSVPPASSRVELPRS